MAQKINIDQRVVKLLYYRYKAFFLPLGIIVVSLLLFFVVIVPQTNNLLALNSQVKQKQAEVQVLTQNKNYIDSFNDADLDTKLKTLSSVLPPNKDFVNTILAIEKAGRNANVQLDDFAFTIGDLATPSGTLSTKLTLDTSLTVRGTLDSEKQFLKELMKTVPISSVSNVTFSKSSASVTISFFYKPFTPITFNPLSPMQQISSSDNDTINEVSSWGSNDINDLSQTNVSIFSTNTNSSGTPSAKVTPIVIPTFPPQLPSPSVTPAFQASGSSSFTSNEPSF